jgi:hypothetical protein
VGGTPGLYNVYATWNFTDNVTGIPITYSVTTNGDSFSVQLDQNGKGDVWVKLGVIDYSVGSIDVEQFSSANTLVSMRSHGLLFEAVIGPEPSTALLVLGGLTALSMRGRRR